MKDIKTIVAENISTLRQMHNMTQSELGERLNYSDKTISKWERGESTPDIGVLVEISDIFGVSMDALVKPMVAEAETVNKEKIILEKPRYNHRAIAYISELVPILVAIFAFIITSLIIKRMSFQWLYFVYAMPIYLIIKLVFNSIWFNPRLNYLIISLLMWSILATIRITFGYFGINVALIYLIGVAGEIIIVLWSFIKIPKNKKQ